MKTSNLQIAENWVSRSFETTGTSLMIVMMEGFYNVVSRKEASKLEKIGYEVI